MSEDTTTQLMRDILDLKRRVSRLEANDKSAVTEWTAWTPEIYGSTGAGTFTYSVQTGLYFVIDSTVFVYGRLAISAVTVGATGNTRIRTLPFTVVAGGNSICNLQARINLTAGYTAYVGQFAASTDFIAINETGDTLLQAFPAASLSNTTDIVFSGFYQAA